MTSTMMAINQKCPVWASLCSFIII